VVHDGKMEGSNLLFCDAITMERKLKNGFRFGNSGYLAASIAATTFSRSSGWIPVRQGSKVMDASGSKPNCSLMIPGHAISLVCRLIKANTNDGIGFCILRRNEFGKYMTSLFREK